MVPPTCTGICPAINPTYSIKNELSKAYNQEGLSTKSTAKATFEKDGSFDNTLSMFTDVVGGKNVAFYCGSDLGGACVIQNNMLTAQANFNAYVHACCGASSCNVLMSNVEKVICPI